MQLALKDNLPFTTVTLAYQGAQIAIANVLVDTGSARTIFAADVVAKINITPAPDDILYSIRGVGGTEVVFSRQVDYVQIGARQLPRFEVEVGGMDYGFDIQGILGMDFLQQAKVILDLAALEITFAQTLSSRSGRLTSACSPTPLRGRYRCAVGLCNAARIEADLGKVAARLTRRALGAKYL